MAIDGRPKKQDSDYIFYELTRSICPRCLEPIDAQILIQAPPVPIPGGGAVNKGRVIMRKRCADHGWFESLISSDAEMYLGSLRYNKPGTMPLALAPRCSTAAPRTAGCAQSTSSTPAWV